MFLCPTTLIPVVRTVLISRHSKDSSGAFGANYSLAEGNEIKFKNAFKTSVQINLVKGRIADLSPLVDANGFILHSSPSNTWFLGPTYESALQTASRSVYPFLQVWSRPNLQNPMVYNVFQWAGQPPKLPLSMGS